MSLKKEFGKVLTAASIFGATTFGTANAAETTKTPEGNTTTTELKTAFSANDFNNNDPITKIDPAKTGNRDAAKELAKLTERSTVYVFANEELAEFITKKIMSELESQGAAVNGIFNTTDKNGHKYMGNPLVTFYDHEGNAYPFFNKNGQLMRGVMTLGDLQKQSSEGYTSPITQMINAVKDRKTAKELLKDMTKKADLAEILKP